MIGPTFPLRGHQPISRVFRKTHEISERCSLHLLHHISSMKLQGDLAYSECRGRLSIQQAAYNERKHLAFTRRKGEVSPLQRRELGASRSLSAVSRKSGPDPGDEGVFAKGLCQEIQRAPPSSLAQSKECHRVPL